MTSWKFDFGPDGEPADGFVKVTAETLYDARRGYGFTGAGQVTARDRRHPEPLKRDLCIPSEAAFRVDLPDGPYTVSVLMGDWILPAVTTIKAAPGRLMLRNRAVPSGQFSRETFAVRAAEGFIRLDFSGAAPRINALEIDSAPQLVGLYLAGDSTVADQPDEGFPYAGWGQMLQAFFKHDVFVSNEARSGRSSKSFIDEGHLLSMLSRIKGDDYLFIQFGHNDQKADEARHTFPESTYPEHLLSYIEGAREKGAHPVLLTPVHRRFYETDGTLKDTHGAYLDAVRKLAIERDVPLIDLAGLSRREMEALGEERSKELFMCGAPGEFANFPRGLEDNTHFQEQGAYRIAGLVAEEVARLNLWPLKLYLKV